jgi:hypothetical protein
VVHAGNVIREDFRCRRPEYRQVCSRATGNSPTEDVTEVCSEAGDSSGRNTRKPVAAARPIPSAMPANVVQERSMFPTSTARLPPARAF